MRIALRSASLAASAALCLAVSSAASGAPMHAPMHAPGAPSTAQAPGAGQDAQEEAPRLPDLQDQTDLSIRWLRGTQDRTTGAYGAGVEATAWVLRALAESPRRYRPEDGFFVRGAVEFLLARQGDDGAIADEGAAGRARRDQTQLAACALFDVLGDATRAPYARALRYLAEAGLGDSYEGLPEYTADKPAATRRVLQLLAARRADGAWDGDGGAVLETARNVTELASYAKLLKSASAPSAGAKPLPTFDEAETREVLESLTRGARFLLTVAEDGKWGAPGQPDAGLTAMVLGALQALPEPRPAEVQRVIDAGLAWLVTLQQDDGGIHQGRLANYVTSASVLALAAAGREEYRPMLVRARDFLVGLQADEGEGYSEGDRYYGGIGYGGDERPDLSNLQMALEALSAAGLDEGHDAYKRAIKFLDRCQNRSESSDLRIIDGDVVIVAGDDGGGQYMPGDSKAGFIELDGGRRVPRSYGSMTYALLKSFVLAGLSRDDERVQAAWEWIQRNYTLDVNPGFDTQQDPRAAYQGLYYYFLSMARALSVFRTDVVTDAEGREHAWRKQLAGRLVAMQSRQDGSWVNENAPRWWEGNPVLATSYAMLALGETLEQADGAGK